MGSSKYWHPISLSAFTVPLMAYDTVSPPGSFAVASRGMDPAADKETVPA